MEDIHESFRTVKQRILVYVLPLAGTFSALQVNAQVSLGNGADNGRNSGLGKVGTLFVAVAGSHFLVPSALVASPQSTDSSKEGHQHWAGYDENLQIKDTGLASANQILRTRKLAIRKDQKWSDVVNPLLSMTSSRLHIANMTPHRYPLWG